VATPDSTPATTPEPASPGAAGSAVTPQPDLSADLPAIMTGICADVLKRDVLGTEEDLTMLGMDSVAAVDIVNRVEAAFGVDVVDVIFDTPTVDRLCAAVLAAQAGDPHVAV
jgi:acyl carrier protein